MSWAVFWIVEGACLLALLICAFMLIRNGWVRDHRLDLINWHYEQGLFADPRSFDSFYGTYDQWLYRRFWVWNPAKLAGLPEWIA